MITIDDGVLVLTREVDGEDILPLNHPGKNGKGSGWFIDIGTDDLEVKNFLIDAEILEDVIQFRYITVNGVEFAAGADIQELICGDEGTMCRLHGKGKAPVVFLADEPKMI